MNRSEYLSAAMTDFDMGVADGQNKRDRGGVGGAYNAGYDGYALLDATKQAVELVAAAGYDDGYAKKPQNVPALPGTFLAGNVITDLTALYGEAYDVGKTAATNTGSKAGWIALGAIGVAAVAFGAAYVVSSKSEGGMRPAMANPGKSVFPPGARVLVDGRDEAIVKQAFPKGSSSYLFPHYRVNFVDGDKDVAVPMSRVGIARCKNPRRSRKGRRS